MSKKLVRNLAVAAVLVVFAYLLAAKAGLFSASPSEKTEQAASSEPAAQMPVSVVEVQATPLRDVLNVSGTIYPDEEVLLASEVSGRVVRLSFREGARVSKGQLLVKVDDSELGATARKLGFQIQLASQQEARKKKLLEIGGISQEEYDGSLTELQTLKAEQQLVQVQINKTEIKAPYSGTIGITDLSVGSYLVPGSQVARLVKTHPAKLEFSVPEKYSNEVELGSPVQFQVEGISEVFVGKVVTRNPSIDMATRTMRVIAESPNPKGRLTPGAFAKVEMVLKEYPQALTIPTEAVVPEQSGQKIFLYKNGVAEARPVVVGIRQANRIQILEGVAAGDSVITTGLLQIYPGASVRLQK
jgi:membrane fusion protein (multidrug efflux system)